MPAPTALEVATLRSHALAVRRAARAACEDDSETARRGLDRAASLLGPVRAQHPRHWRPLRMAEQAAELAVSEPERAVRAADRLLSELP